MIKNLFLVIPLTILLSFQAHAEDYKASMFGIKSNGTTLNTNSIQKAIDFIHEKGGGRLVFYVGRYLTGTIQLKSNVTIHLEEGATLLGSTNIYDYNIEGPRFSSLITAYQADNIGLTGKGVIDGQGRDLAYALLDQVQKGVLKDELANDRPALRRPKGIYFRECKNVEISGIMVKNAAEWVVVCAGAMGFAGPRSIVGVLNGPTIDEKGNLLNSAGYHLIGGAGWFMVAPVEGLTIPDQCTLAVCQDAVARIHQVVEFFPWATNLDFPKWLTGLIAANARGQVDVSPMMLVTAHSAGSGKSYLVRMISWILTGAEPDLMPWPADDRNRDDELRKLLSGLVQGGATLAAVDNFPTGSELSSAVLCAFLTAPIFKARRLGVNDGTTSGGINRVFMIGSGNNVTPASDLADRMLMVRLDAPEENRRSNLISTYGAIGDAIGYVRDPKNRRE